MALIAWDQSYSVKVAKLDEDHQTLFSLLNKLYDAMHEGRGTAVIQSIVNELVDYTRTHFQREEALMAQTKFVGLPSHRLEHQKLISQVAEYKTALDAGKRVNTTAVLEFLRGWLAKHINGMDKGYSAHLNANGIH